ncbi:mpv17-like protein [Phlebotomus argentipes]|uniref:mpv17-like protein n=1 Tax=Phlebotomus argentipes TaxID=94469 RepID=UPI002892FDD9|nr:mpv17-like protein [Phlebotomus argentipes]XP_059622841.1 mpv17-like protein [Phlebotomus argentipes]XP_059622842.1 mpv17-like protein [Phlebotomus argentipes]
MAFLRTFFRQKPFVANSLIYGSLYVGAEFSQQWITRKVFTKPPEPLDMAALGRYTVMGTAIYSPILYAWYKWLDRKYVGTTLKILVPKLALDQFLLTPCLLVIFFTAMSTMEGAEDKLQECREKILPTFVRSCLFWLPVQSLNFVFIPPAFRVTFMGVAAFAWVNILCWIKRQQPKTQA